MSFEKVFSQLEAWGSENTRKIYARHGAGDNKFGVTLGNLRSLAKKLKSNHALALQLWATGNADAMILATMLMAPGELSAPEIENMVKPVTCFKLIDELVFNVVVNSAHSEKLRSRWMDSPKEMQGRAGWNLLIDRITKPDTGGLDFDEILKTIEAGILAALKRKQEAMNRCLVEIGIHFPEFTRQCVALGERLGRFDKTPVPKGCTSSYAPEWIAAALQRQKGSAGGDQASSG